MERGIVWWVVRVVRDGREGGGEEEREGLEELGWWIWVGCEKLRGGDDG